MDRIGRLVIPLRILFVFVFAVLLVAQTLSLPGQFAYMGQEPDEAYLRWPLTILSVLVVLCIQIVIVCTWKLLTMVRDDRIFSERAFVWVNGIVWSIAAGWVMVFGMAVYMAPKIDEPAAVATLVVTLLVGAVLGLLMVVMRALLRQATALRTDMNTVI